MNHNKILLYFKGFCLIQDREIFHNNYIFRNLRFEKYDIYKFIQYTTYLFLVIKTIIFLI